MSYGTKISAKQASTKDIGFSTTSISKNPLGVASGLYKSSSQLHNIMSLSKSPSNKDTALIALLEYNVVGHKIPINDNTMFFSEIDYLYTKQPKTQLNDLLGFSTTSNEITNGKLKHTALVSTSNTSTLLELAKQDR
jgi:hypothetical protein